MKNSVKKSVKFLWKFLWKFGIIFTRFHTFIRWRKTGMLKISFLYKNRLSYEPLVLVSNTRSAMCVRVFWRQMPVYTLLSTDEKRQNFIRIKTSSKIYLSANTAVLKILFNTFLARGQKLFAKVSKHSKSCFFGEKTFFSSNGFFGHVECSFDKPAENFWRKDWFSFAQQSKMNPKNLW